MLSGHLNGKCLAYFMYSSHLLRSHGTAEHDGTKAKEDTTSLQPSQCTLKALPEHILGIVPDLDLKDPTGSRAPTRMEGCVTCIVFKQPRHSNLMIMNFTLTL